jgi:hypothetical protein
MVDVAKEIQGSDRGACKDKYGIDKFVITERGRSITIIDQLTIGKGTIPKNLFM